MPLSRLVVAVVALLFVRSVIAEESVIDDFTLSSHRGVKWSLSDVKDSKLVVVAFLGTECPLARLYGPRLSELQERYEQQGVAFVGINANTQDSMTEITLYVAKHNITFPMLKDVGNRIADQFDAERTPEVFLLDQDRRVRYRGRVDDQYLVGRSRNTVNRQDLAIAIDELLAGKTVSVARTTPQGCHIGRVRSTPPRGDVTWSNQIVRIFNRSCVECHRAGEIAPFQLSKYDDVAGWEDTILEVIADNRMPPWFANPDHGTFSNDARLSESDKKMIRSWVANGMPEGNAEDLPEPPRFVEGWRIPEPDQIIEMRKTAFEIPADGIVNYQYFEVDPGWDEEKFVSAVEARPDNLSVVHHIIAYIVPKDSKGRRGRNRRMLVAYAPGSTPHILDEGTAIHVPADSKLVFELHYTPNGTKQTDLSYIGVKFTERSKVQKLLHGAAASNHNFQIPPGDAGHTVEADYLLRSDQMLLEMSPHMHLRGKSFRFEAFYPDGQDEILLDVPHYDFNWQLTYKLAEPKLMPKGTRIHCTAVFDNSKHNLVNPDPTKTVRWGNQSWEEMMIGFLTGVDANPVDKKTASAR